MKVQTFARIPVKVEINNRDALNTLIYNIFHKESISDIVEKDNALYFEFDVSMHGSPLYEYELISKDQNLIEIYRHLKTLSNLINKFESKKAKKDN